MCAEEQSYSNVSPKEPTEDDDKYVLSTLTILRNLNGYGWRNIKQRTIARLFDCPDCRICLILTPFPIGLFSACSNLSISPYDSRLGIQNPDNVFGCKKIYCAEGGNWFSF